MDIDVEKIMKEIRDKARSDNDENIKLHSHYFFSIMKKLREKKDIVIFGSGKYGRQLYEKLSYEDILVRCFCDNNLNAQKTKIMGKEIISPEQAYSRYPEAEFVISAINYPVEISAQLIEMGVDVKNIIFYNAARDVYVYDEA